MKSKLIAVVGIAALCLAGQALAADQPDLEAIKKECSQYAKEDGVSAEEMEEYMTQCMEDLSAPQGEEGEGEKQSDG